MAEQEWFIDGKHHYRMLELNLFTRLRVAQAGFNSQYTRTAESFGGVQYDNIWHLYQDASIQPSDLFQLSASATYGHKIARRYYTMGKTLDISISAGVKPHPRLLLQQWLDYARATNLDTGAELYDGYIYRTRINYQISRPLTIRMIVEYNDFQKQLSVDPLVTFRLNPFSVFYFGSTCSYIETIEEGEPGVETTSNRLASRQFFAKLQYLFQL
jgi:hypothetical protein